MYQEALGKYEIDGPTMTRSSLAQLKEAMLKITFPFPRHIVSHKMLYAHPLTSIQETRFLIRCSLHNVLLHFNYI